MKLKKLAIAMAVAGAVMSPLSQAGIKSQIQPAAAVASQAAAAQVSNLITLEQAYTAAAAQSSGKVASASANFEYGAPHYEFLLLEGQTVKWLTVHGELSTVLSNETVTMPPLYSSKVALADAISTVTAAHGGNIVEAQLEQDEKHAAIRMYGQNGETMYEALVSADTGKVLVYMPFSAEDMEFEDDEGMDGEGEDDMEDDMGGEDGACSIDDEWDDEGEGDGMDDEGEGSDEQGGRGGWDDWGDDEEWDDEDEGDWGWKTGKPNTSVSSAKANAANAATVTASQAITTALSSVTGTAISVSQDYIDGATEDAAEIAAWAVDVEANGYISTVLVNATDGTVAKVYQDEEKALIDAAAAATTHASLATVLANIKTAQAGEVGELYLEMDDKQKLVYVAVVINQDKGYLVMVNAADGVVISVENYDDDMEDGMDDWEDDEGDSEGSTGSEGTSGKAARNTLKSKYLKS